MVIRPDDHVGIERLCRPSHRPDGVSPAEVFLNDSPRSDGDSPQNYEDANIPETVAGAIVSNHLALPKLVHAN